MSVDLDLTWRGVTGGQTPRRCTDCNAPFTRSLNEKGRILFCGNRHCRIAGRGFLELKRNVWVDGVFKDALEDLFTYTTAAYVAKNEADRAGLEASILKCLELAIETTKERKYADVVSILETTIKHHLGELL